MSGNFTPLVFSMNSRPTSNDASLDVPSAMVLIRPSPGAKQTPSGSLCVATARGRGRDSVPGPEGATNERLQTPFNDQPINKQKLEINDSFIHPHEIVNLFLASYVM